MLVICFAHPFAAWPQDGASNDPLPPTDSAPTPATTPDDHQQRWSREWLESRGVIFEAGYRGEVFSNLRGGINDKWGGDYLGSADLNLMLNLKELHLGRGAIVVSAQSVHGNGINDREIGAVEPPSNLDAAAFNKLLEVYFTDTIFRKRISFKAGRLYADSNFDVIESACDFLNSSYGRIPTVPMPTYPSPQFGATVWTTLSQRLSVGAGIYTAPKLDAPDDTGRTISTGPFTILETKLDLFSSNAAFHGTYSVGVWQQGRSAWTSLDNLAPARNYGLYATGQHWFRKALAGVGNVGPSVFFQLGWSPADRNQISTYWGVGAAYPGLLPKRSADNIGIGVTQARLVAGNETVLELFYKIQGKKIFVQPDLQWFNKPSGEGHNALVGGLRIGIRF